MKLNFTLSGSQAVSSTNLTNDDTLSIRSMSVDDTPDFDRTTDYTHISRTKNSMVGLRNEISELRNDIHDLKNDIVVSKHELDDPTFEKSKSPITPGGKRINPFLRDCEEATEAVELLLDPLGALPVDPLGANPVNPPVVLPVDPLGALPVESAKLSSQKSVESAQTNGESHDNSVCKYESIEL